MIATNAGRRVCAALFCIALVASAPAGAQPVLAVETSDASIAELAFSPGSEICLTWNHSVTGGSVADCFENVAGKLTLTRSYLHDFAAGLGEVAGRGTIAPAAEGGYWITDIAEHIPRNTLALRVGPAAVNHTLTGDDVALPLSRIAPDTAVWLTLRHD